MQVWNLLQAARWKHRTQKSRQKSPSGHYRTTLSGYIFASKARIDNRKKNLLSSNMSSRSPHNMVNIGPLTAENDWRVWGTRSYFSRYHVLEALLHGSQVVGVSQTLQHWTEGATYVRQGDHHVGDLITASMSTIFLADISYVCSSVSGWHVCIFVMQGSRRKGHYSAL